MREISEKEWSSRFGISRGKAAIFVFTPLCGTCKLAERMLGILETMHLAVLLYKLNINFAPKLREEWKITSIPCLILLENGKPLRFEYAMKSVDYLYGVIQGLSRNRS